MMTLLFAGLLCRAGLLFWLAEPPPEGGHGAPCYRGLGVSYWRARLSDWRIDGGERPETAAERLQEKEEQRRGKTFIHVHTCWNAGQWWLHHRETAGLVAYCKLREVQNDFHNLMAGTEVGIIVNPTYGEPFCKLEILEGDPAAVPVLTALLKDRDMHIRRIAAFALLRIGRKAKKAIPALLEVANQDRTCSSVGSPEPPHASSIEQQPTRPESAKTSFSRRRNLSSAPRFKGVSFSTLQRHAWRQERFCAGTKTGRE